MTSSFFEKLIVNLPYEEPALHHALDKVGQPTDNLIIEVKGYGNQNVNLKSGTMKTQWVPGINNLSAYGRWAFEEFGDVYEMDQEFKALTEGTTANRSVEEALQ